MSADSMQGRVVASTGAFGAPGRAVAAAFAAAGADLALLDLSSPGQSLQAQFRTAPLLIGGVDLANMPAALAAMESVRERYGRLDALVNVAGGFRWQTLGQGDIDTRDFMYS